MAFDHSTGSRLGAAVRLERIMPVVYSPVMVSAPRTATASWPSVTATVNGASGSVRSAWAALDSAGALRSPGVIRTVEG